MCPSAAFARLLPPSGCTPPAPLRPKALVPSHAAAGSPAALRPQLSVCASSPPLTPVARVASVAALAASAPVAPAPEPLDVTAEIVAMGAALRRRARRLTRSAAEAEDLAQETVLRALDVAPEFASREHLRAWLYTVLRNAFVSRRRRERNAERVLAELKVAGELRAPAPGAGFLTSSVERALDALPEAFSRVVRLVDLEDNSYADASQALGVPIGTIMSRLFRGRQRLARALAAP